MHFLDSSEGKLCRLNELENSRSNLKNVNFFSIDVQFSLAFCMSSLSEINRMFRTFNRDFIREQRLIWLLSFPVADSPKYWWIIKRSSNMASLSQIVVFF